MPPKTSDRTRQGHITAFPGALVLSNGQGTPEPQLPHTSPSPSTQPEPPRPSYSDAVSDRVSFPANVQGHSTGTRALGSEPQLHTLPAQRHTWNYQESIEDERFQSPQEFPAITSQKKKATSRNNKRQTKSLIDDMQMDIKHIAITTFIHATVVCAKIYPLALPETNSAPSNLFHTSEILWKLGIMLSLFGVIINQFIPDIAKQAITTFRSTLVTKTVMVAPKSVLHLGAIFTLNSIIFHLAETHKAWLILLLLNPVTLAFWILGITQDCCAVGKAVARAKRRAQPQSRKQGHV
ncbi:hypothetical protein SISSUDRAFT_1126646 [Sistotremastrum suecicum HHB10207 ss-3]|uniref:Uncharacterized protein n=1 Tax=Sistotremastrum suecicum HHB10207 ss-3 TaxID=1314776 RepID=A0A166G4A1_9AGAM|nr:hypothetical protein SISSUDRAFT_1126646 [Sistotremastrum suecicum HHB10207 ss-3]